MHLLAQPKLLLLLILMMAMQRPVHTSAMPKLSVMGHLLACQAPLLVLRSVKLLAMLSVGMQLFQ